MSPTALAHSSCVRDVDPGERVPEPLRRDRAREVQQRHGQRHRDERDDRQRRRAGARAAPQQRCAARGSRQS